MNRLEKVEPELKERPESFEGFRTFSAATPIGFDQAVIDGRSGDDIRDLKVSRVSDAGLHDGRDLRQVATAGIKPGCEDLWARFSHRAAPRDHDEREHPWRAKPSVAACDSVSHRGSPRSPHTNGRG